ncbi:MAG: transposase [Nitrospirota bacterium]|nr:transposase [Nitrospirota bacterium]
MPFNPDIHHRKSIRLKDYDYSQRGAYFVTVCTWNREHSLGTIEQNVLQPSGCGDIVLDCWNALPNHYPHIMLDAFTLMPNHIHGIIMIMNDVVRAGLKPAPTENHHGLSEIVRALKTFSSRRINASRKTPGMPVWQRNYYEHVIRNDDDLNAIREYIQYNPAGWDRDEENPHFVGAGFKPAPAQDRNNG